MIKDAIANIAKPPVFSTASAPVLPIHSGAVQRGKSDPFRMIAVCSTFWAILRVTFRTTTALDKRCPVCRSSSFIGACRERRSRSSYAQPRESYQHFLPRSHPGKPVLSLEERRLHLL